MSMGVVSMTGTEQWLGGAALVGMLAALWGKIKLLSWRLINLLVVRARLEGDVGTAVAYYCWITLRRSPFGEKRFNSTNEFVQPMDRYQVVGYEQVSYDPAVFWLGWRPMLVGMDVNALKGGGSNSAAVTITFIRGTFNLDQFIITALDRLNEVRHTGEEGSRFGVRRRFGNGSMRMARWQGEGKRSSDSPEVAREGSDAQNNPDRRYLKWERHDIGMPRGVANPFSNLAFPANVLDAVARCRRWLLSNDWYKRKEIPWRLGVLLYGKPGAGKTSFVRAIGRELNMPIFSYDLASFGNRDFESEWQSMMNSTPCIALLEDVDAVFDGRENRLGEEGGGLTFDCLLNCIGGVKDANGVLLFVTTNRPECLDDALGKPGDLGMSTRPGRIDLAVELGELDTECRKRLATRILADCPQFIDAHVRQGEGMTGAQFTELCSKTALEYYWRDGGVHIPTTGKTPIAPSVQADTYDDLLGRLKDSPPGEWTRDLILRR